MNKIIKTVVIVCLAGLAFLCLAPTSSVNQYYGYFFGSLTGTRDSNLNGYSLTNGNTIQATNIITGGLTVNSTNPNSAFAGSVLATNGFTAIGGVFTGNGSGLTNLSGSGGVAAPGIGMGVTTNGSVYTVYKDTTDDRSLFIDEEFLTGSIASGGIGAYGWTSVAINSGTTSGNNATVAGHPGIFRLDTTTVGGSGVTLTLSDSGTPGHYPIFGMQTVPWRMRLIFETSSTNHQRFWYGVAAATMNATNLPTTGVFVTFDAVVSNQMQLMCADGSGNQTVNLLQTQNTTWYDVLIGSDVAGTVWANINGTTGFTNTTHCPSAALSPVAQNALEDNGSSSVSFYIDAFKLWQNYPQRY